MRSRILLAALLSVSAVGLAEDFADSAKLAGSWDQDGKTAWKLAPTNDGVHFTFTRGGQTVADFECNTSGKDCPIKMEGKKATVSVYFNGPLLVMMQTRGNDVVKWRFGALGDGNQMQVEMTAITGGAKSETLHYKRTDAPQAASR
jgi:hypothetical protein